MKLNRPTQNGHYVGKDGHLYNSAEDFLQMDILNFCGCGNPEESLLFTRKTLQKIKARSDNFCDPTKLSALEGWLGPAYEFVLYVLTEKGIIEHGGSIYGSWLTSKGVQLLDDLNRLYNESK